MCGIVGVINREKIFNDKQDMIKIFNQLLYCDNLRGKHGTGVVLVDKDGGVASYKRALSAPDFLEHSFTKKIIDDTDNIFFIGHNRWATKGAHTTDNTHPFNYNYIHLVHNGTLDYFKGLNPGKNFDVDSEALTYYLSHAEDKIKALETFEGAYSLVWYDELEETLNFARNAERPMYFASLDKSDSWLFGSEPGLLRWIANRNGYGVLEVKSLEPGKLLSVSLDPKVKPKVLEFTPKKKTVGYTTHISNKQDDLVGREIDLYFSKYEPYTSTNTATGKLIGKYHGIQLTLHSVKKKDIDKYLNKNVKVKIKNIYYSGTEKTGSIEIVTQSNVIVHPSVEYSVHNGQKVSKERYINLTKCGCSNCSADITPEDQYKIYWDWSGNPYCEECGELFNSTQGFGVNLKQVI